MLSAASSEPSRLRPLHGGLVDPLAGSIQPARLVEGLARAAERAGARLVERAEVRGRERPAGEWPSRGGRDARSGRSCWWPRTATPVRRCRAPAPGRAGRELSDRDAPPRRGRARLIPRGRVLSDTKNLLYYFRLSPDGRMVFGGRAAFTPTPVARSAAVLEGGMVEVFPELADTAIDYAWGGQVAFARDQMPHAGSWTGALRDGLWRARCRHGHLARRAHGQASRAAPMPRITTPFRAVPCYRGRRGSSRSSGGIIGCVTG